MFVLKLPFRDQDLDVVLETIRFRQISTKFLKTRVFPELVEGEGRCRSDVEEALASRRLSQENNDPGTPRNSRKVIYLFSMKTNRVDTFDEEKSACVPCPELASSDVGRYDNYRCAVIVQDELYAVSKMAVNRFNPVTRKWTWIGEGKVSVSARKPNTAMMAEQFSIEGRKKTKTIAITLANHKRHRQHNEPISTRSKYLLRTQSAGKRLWTCYGSKWFTSDWTRKWREFFRFSF